MKTLRMRDGGRCSFVLFIIVPDFSEPTTVSEGRRRPCCCIVFPLAAAFFDLFH